MNDIAARDVCALCGDRSQTAASPFRVPWSRPQVWMLVTFVVVLDAFLVGPLIGRGSLQLLDFGDYPAGPHPQPVVTAYGFPPGLTNRVPVDLITYWTFAHVRWPVASGQVLAVSILAFGLAGGLLAAGTRGPTGDLYLWMFWHVPGFKVMREAQKFSALLVLAYAVCFGWGSESLVQALSRRRTRLLGACCFITIPIWYGYTELLGFAGYARPSVIPATWVAADRSMVARTTALALPWRAYLQAPWADNRIVANPMSSYFNRRIISADDIEAGSIATETSNPRSRFLQFCQSEGSRVTEFGRLLAPLGIGYIVLAKGPDARGYGWLGRQHDLRLVYNAADIAVYQNEETVMRAYRPHIRLVLPDWGAVVALAQRVPLTDYLIAVKHAQPGKLQVPSKLANLSARPPAVAPITASSPVSQRLSLSAASNTVVLTDPAFAGWRLRGYRVTSQFGVAVAFYRPSIGIRQRQITLVARYTPWELVRVWDIVGACVAAADVMLLALVVLYRRSRAAAEKSGLSIDVKPKESVP